MLILTRRFVSAALDTRVPELRSAILDNRRVRRFVLSAPRPFPIIPTLDISNSLPDDRRRLPPPFRYLELQGRFYIVCGLLEVPDRFTPFCHAVADRPLVQLFP